MSDSTVTLKILNNRTEKVYIYFSNTTNSITGTTSAGDALKISNASGKNTAEAYPIDACTTDAKGKLVPGTFTCTISDLASGRVGFSLDELTYGNMGQFNNSNSATNGGDYTKRYDKFELNVSSGVGTCDLTALDWVGVPFSLTTNDSTSAVATGGWTSAFTTVINDLANNAVVDQTTNANGMALVTGTDGVPTTVGTTPMNIVRIIGPNTAVAEGTPYNAIGDAIGVLKKLTNPIHIKGTGYDMTGGVDASGDINLTGTLNSTANQTMSIKSTDLTSIQIYGANPQNVSINGKTPAPPSTVVEQAACRDVYAGLNLGAWGSSTKITSGTFKGDTVGSLDSEQLRTFGSSLDVTDIQTYFFAGASANYNESAEIICVGSSNSIYGFPYSDYLGGQLMTANPGKELTLTVLPD